MQIGNSKRRPIGQASQSLEAPRLQALETRDLFHQQNRKGKIVMTKTSRYKGLVLGSFLVPEIDMIFGDGVGASLHEKKQVKQHSHGPGKAGKTMCMQKGTEKDRYIH